MSTSAISSSSSFFPSEIFFCYQNKAKIGALKALDDLVLAFCAIPKAIHTAADFSKKSLQRFNQSVMDKIVKQQTFKVFKGIQLVAFLAFAAIPYIPCAFFEITTKKLASLFDSAKKRVGLRNYDIVALELQFFQHVGSLDKNELLSKSDELEKLIFILEVILEKHFHYFTKTPDALDQALFVNRVAEMCTLLDRFKIYYEISRGEDCNHLLSPLENDLLKDEEKLTFLKWESKETHERDSLDYNTLLSEEIAFRVKEREKGPKLSPIQKFFFKKIARVCEEELLRLEKIKDSETTS